MRLRDMRTPFSRRDMLKLGGMVFGGITLPKVLRASRGRSDVSCLIFFQTGGASQLDSFDPNPAPHVKFGAALERFQRRSPAFISPSIFRDAQKRRTSSR